MFILIYSFYQKSSLISSMQKIWITYQLFTITLCFYQISDINHTWEIVLIYYNSILLSKIQHKPHMQEIVLIYQK